MKRKIIITFMILLLLTGCKIEYKINLNNNLDIEEIINIIPTTQEDTNEFNEFSLHIPIDKEADDYSIFTDKSEKIEYYNFKRKKEILEFSYNYQRKEQKKYLNSTLINSAYEYISISEVDDNTLVLSTSKEFRLFDRYESLEEVKVTINTNYKVLKSNADEINRHNYTWIITKDNAYGKGIYLKIDPTKEDLTFLEKLMRGDYFNIFTVSIILALIGFIIYKLLKRHSEKVNKIK